MSTRTRPEHSISDQGRIPRRRQLCRRLDEPRSGRLRHWRVRPALRQLRIEGRRRSFEVNTYTTSTLQVGPDVAVDGSGNFVVVWDSYEQDGSELAFSASASTAPERGSAASFRSTPTRRTTRVAPSIAIGRTGNFVVVWQSSGRTDPDLGVFGQRFDGSGAKVGAEFQVNSYTTDDQSDPSVAMDGAGNFVVVWTPTDGSSNGVFGQRFDGSGAKVGAEFQVNTYTTGDQIPSAVARRPERQLRRGLEARTGSAHGRLRPALRRSGRKIGTEFPINTYTTGIQVPALAVDSNRRLRRGLGERRPGRIGLGRLRPAIRPFRRQGRQRVPGQQRTRQAFKQSPKVDRRRPRIRRRLGGLRASEDPRAFSAAGRRLYPLALARGLALRQRYGLGSERRPGAGRSRPRRDVVVATSRAGSFANLTGTAASLSGPSGHVLSQRRCRRLRRVAAGRLGRCNDGSSDACYAVTIGGPSRPATHWDANLQEDLSVGGAQFWKIHLGDSFNDVPRSQPFYAKIETLLHNGITSGCDGDAVLPRRPGPAGPDGDLHRQGTRRLRGDTFRPRARFSSRAGSPTTAPPAGPLSSSTFSRPTSSASTSTTSRRKNVTLGCGGFKYCPGHRDPRRDGLLHRQSHRGAQGGGNGVPETFSHSGRSYSCNAASPNIHFTDVPASNPFCKHIHYPLGQGDRVRLLGDAVLPGQIPSTATRWPSSSPTGSGCSSMGRKVAAMKAAGPCP